MQLFETIWKNEGSWTYSERVYDTDLKRSIVREIDSQPEYYVEHSRGLYTYLLDDQIKLQKKLGRPSKNDGTVYGKLDPIQRHIRDKYWDAEKPKYNLDPNMWYFDIETTAYGKIDQINTPEEVVLIQIYDTHKKTMFLLGSRDWTNQEKYEKEYGFDVKYVNCRDEIGIFNAYFKLLKALQPLFVFGWNTNGFDYPYMYNRAKKLGLDTNQFSFCGSTSLSDRTHLNNGMPSFKLFADGIHYFDYLEIYRKFTYAPRTSYSLDSIALVELKQQKIDHSIYSTFDGFRTGKDYMMPDEEPEDEYWKEMYHLQKQYKETPTVELEARIHDLANDLFVHYGCVDTFLVKKLDEKLMLSNVMMNISSKMGVTADASLGTVKPWGSYINNVAYTNKQILPSIPVDDDADTSIKGGYVADPQTGKHEWIVSVDINSAYPNLSMRGFNMSAETYCSPADMSPELREMNLRYFSDEDEEARFKLYLEQPEVFRKYTELLKRDDLSGSVSGAVFTRDKQGIIPKLLEGIYGDRKRQKNEMLMWKQKAITLKTEMEKRGL